MGDDFKRDYLNEIEPLQSLSPKGLLSEAMVGPSYPHDLGFPIFLVCGVDGSSATNIRDHRALGLYNSVRKVSGKRYPRGKD